MAATTTEQQAPRFISKKELEEHDEEAERQWILIENQIVDITDYKHQHPGGDEILLEHAGADGTESFNNVGHSKEARNSMMEYVVGVLHPDDATAGNKKSTSNDSGDEDSTSTGSKNGGGLSGLVKYAVIPVVIFASAYFIQKYMAATGTTHSN